MMCLLLSFLILKMSAYLCFIFLAILVFTFLRIEIHSDITSTYIFNNISVILFLNDAYTIVSWVALSI